MQRTRQFPRLILGMLLMGAWAMCSTASLAQVTNGNLLPQPRLSAITPLGGKIGSTFEVTFSGADMEEPKALRFTHPGITAQPIIPPEPKVDPKKKNQKPKPRPPVTKFKVTIAGNTPPGFYDVRFVNKWGISNPRRFAVGKTDQVLEKEPNSDAPQAQPIKPGEAMYGVINNNTDVDIYTIEGKKGQRILLWCQGPSLDSQINPEIQLFNEKNIEVSYERPAPNKDALLDAFLPADGKYYVRVSHFTHTAGGNDYFYRLSYLDTPWIDVVYPPMVEPGKTAQVTVYGRNLPGGKLDPNFRIDGQPLEKLTASVKAPNDANSLQELKYNGRATPVVGVIDGFEYRISTPNGVSNPALLTYATAPVIMEKEDNDSPDSAQKVPCPIEVAGRIDKAGDRDWFSFTAKKGDVYMIEVMSHRLGAPTDMNVSIWTKDGTQRLQSFDDTSPPLSQKGFYSNSRDPEPYRFVVPADGTYHVLAQSHLAYTHYGVNHIYRLRISPPRPDFRLFALGSDFFRPDVVHVGKGGNECFTVVVDRRDGFSGDVNVSIAGLPAGVTAKNDQVISQNMQHTLFVVSAAPNAAETITDITIKGTATIKGKNVVHDARPVSITWALPGNQNIPAISRLDDKLIMAVQGREAPFTMKVGNDKATVVHGGKLTIPITLNRLWKEADNQVQIQQMTQDLPNQLRHGVLNIPKGKNNGSLAFNNIATNVPPGKYNIVFRGFVKINYIRDPKTKKKQNNLNVVQCTTPLELTILPKTNAQVTATNVNIKVGAKGDVKVTLRRLYNFDGPFKVELIPPNNVKDVSAPAITIPEDENVGKFTVQIPANAKPGARSNLVVRATSMMYGTPIVQETKFNLTITK